MKASLHDHLLTHVRRTLLCSGRGWDCAELVPWEWHMSIVDAIVVLRLSDLQGSFALDLLRIGVHSLQRQAEEAVGITYIHA